MFLLHVNVKVVQLSVLNQETCEYVSKSAATTVRSVRDLLLHGLRPKSARASPPSVHSECSKFHQNRFTLNWIHYCLQCAGFCIRDWNSGDIAAF